VIATMSAPQKKKAIFSLHGACYPNPYNMIQEHERFQEQKVA